MYILSPAVGMGKPYYTLESLVPETSVAFLIRRCGMLMAQVAEARFASQPISLVQWQILIWLTLNPVVRIYSIATIHAPAKPMWHHKSVIGLFQIVLRLLTDLIAMIVFAFRRRRAAAAHLEIVDTPLQYRASAHGAG